MHRWRRLATVAGLSAGLAAAAACSGSILVAVNTIPPGTWGGQHATLVVADGGSTIQLDCAHGNLASPIQIDHDGRFDVQGIFVREHGGPIVPGASQDRHSASFSGTVINGQLTLFISVGDLGLNLGPFLLVLGGPSQIVRCV